MTIYQHNQSDLELRFMDYTDDGCLDLASHQPPQPGRLWSPRDIQSGLPTG